MSIVENAVATLSFDNKDFEKKTAESLGTLDKLKGALKFDGVSRGFEAISNAAAEVSFAPIEKGIEAMHSSMSLAETFIQTAFFRISNAALSAGKQIVSSLTVDPIKTGLQEYETQINSVQTILANTESKGSTLEDVNAALDELNHYADMTIYNFTQMTRNIGTFTAAGVDLETSTAAIKGIANLAAVSGSTAQQASTAMYQLSQALASGTVKLQDWNSVVNAGMGGQVFQDALKETAKVHKINIDAMIKRDGSFRETLQTGWLSTEILLETLQKFTGDLSEEQLKEMGYTKEQIESIIKLGETANDAATKVKTFSQLKDTLAEAAQSGWTQSWEIIIGDFEEAKDLYTRISDSVSDILNKSADTRNNVLEMAFSSSSSKWKSIVAEVKNAGGEYVDFEDQLKKVAKKYGLDVDAMIKESGSLEKSLESGWLTTAMLSETFANLGTVMKKDEKTGQDVLKYSKSQISAFTDMSRSIKLTNNWMHKFTDTLNQKGARQTIIDAAANSFHAIGNVIDRIKRAWQSFFSPITSDTIVNIANAIEAASQKFLSFTENNDNLLKISHSFQGLFAILDIGKQILEAVFNKARNVTSVFGPALTGILNFIDPLGKDIRDFANQLRKDNYFEQFIDNIVAKIDEFKEKMFKLLPSNVATFITNIRDSIQNGLNTITDGTTSFYETVKKRITDAVEYIKTKWGEFRTAIETKFNLKPYDILRGIITTIYNVFKLALGAANAFKFGIVKMFEKIDSTYEGNAFFGLLAHIVDLARTAAVAIGQMIWKLVGNVANAFKSISANDVVQFFQGLAAGTFTISIASVAKSLSNFINGFGEVVESIGEVAGKFSGVLDGFRETLKAYENNLNAKTLKTIGEAVVMLVGSLVVLSLLDPQTTANGVITVGELLAALVGAVSILAKMDTKKVAAAAAGVTSLSIGLLLMTAAVAILAHVDTGGVIKAVAALGAILLGIQQFMEHIKTKRIKTVGLAMQMFSIAFIELAAAILLISLVDSTKLADSVVALGAVMLGMMEFVNHLDSKGILAKSVGISVLAGSMIVLAGAVAIFGAMPTDMIMQGLIGLASALLVMSLACNYTKGNMEAAGSILVMSLAIDALVPGLMLLGAMPLLDLIQAIIGVAAALAIFGAAAKLLTPVIPAMKTLALTLAEIGIAMALLGVGVLAVSAAILALGTAVGVGGNAFIIGVQTMILAAVSFVPTLVTAFIEGLDSIRQAILAGITMLLQILKDLLVSALDLIIEVIPKLLETVGAVLNALVEYGPEIYKAIFTIVIDVLTAIAENIKPISDKLLEIFLGALDVLIERAAAIIERVVTLVIALINGVADALRNNSQGLYDAIKNLLSSIVDTIVTVVKQGIPELVNLGGELLDGIIDGIGSGLTALKNKAGEICTTIADKVTGFFGISSPSKLTTSYGEFISQGLINGIGSKEKEATRVVDKFGNSVTGGLRKAMSDVNGYLDGDLDLNPVITPVLDLDEVDKGTKQLKHSFDNIGTKSGVYNLASSMNANMASTAAFGSGPMSAGTANGWTNTFMINSTDPKGVAEEIDRKLGNKLMGALSKWG